MDNSLLPFGGVLKKMHAGSHYNEISAAVKNGISLISLIINDEWVTEQQAAMI